MDSAKTVTAEFQEQTPPPDDDPPGTEYELTKVLSVSGNGKVLISGDGIDCTITATSKSGICPETLAGGLP